MLGFPLDFVGLCEIVAASRAAEALADLLAGFTRAWMWSALAYQDIKLRYRGSLLGPFWITLTSLVLLVAMGEIYAALFKVETSTYIPFLMTGLLIWQFLSTVANGKKRTTKATAAASA